MFERSGGRRGCRRWERAGGGIWNGYSILCVPRNLQGLEVLWRGAGQKLDLSSEMRFGGERDALEQLEPTCGSARHCTHRTIRLQADTLRPVTILSKFGAFNGNNKSSTLTPPEYFGQRLASVQSQTRYGFTSLGDYRRDHRQPPAFQPPFLLSHCEKVAKTEPKTRPRYHLLPFRIQSEQLVHGHAQQPRWNHILRPSRYIQRHHRMERSRAFRPRPPELQLADDVRDVLHGDA